MTVSVNLLPWREQLREQRKRAFLLSLLATAALAVCIVVLVERDLRLDIREQLASNDRLRRDIAAATASVQEIGELQQRDRHIADRLAAFGQLQEGRSDQARLFEMMARAVPADVQLDVLRRRGHSLQVEGIANTHNAVAEFMRGLASDRTLRPSLHRISAATAGSGDAQAVGAFLLTLDPTAVPKAPPQHMRSE